MISAARTNSAVARGILFATGGRKITGKVLGILDTDVGWAGLMSFHINSFGSSGGYGTHQWRLHAREIQRNRGGAPVGGVVCETR